MQNLQILIIYVYPVISLTKWHTGLGLVASETSVFEDYYNGKCLT